MSETGALQVKRRWALLKTPASKTLQTRVRILHLSLSTNTPSKGSSPCTPKRRAISAQMGLVTSDFLCLCYKVVWYKLEITKLCRYASLPELSFKAESLAWAQHDANIVVHTVSSTEVTLTVGNTDGVSCGQVMCPISATASQKVHARANYRTLT